MTDAKIYHFFLLLKIASILLEYMFVLLLLCYNDYYLVNNDKELVILAIIPIPFPQFHKKIQE